MGFVAFYTTITNKLIPEKNQENIDLYYQSFLLVGAYIFSTIFLLLFITMHYVTGNYLESYILGIDAVLFPILLLFYTRSGNNVMFGNFIVAGGFFAFLVIAYIDGGINAPVIPWFTAVSITSFLFANKKSGYFWTTLAILSILTYYIMARMGIDLVSWFPPENRLKKLGSSYLGSSIYIIATVLSYEYLSAKKNNRLQNLLISNAEKREELKRQRDTVLSQRDKLQEVYNIVDKSIDYATRIQQSILPDMTILQKTMSDKFILFKPRDKVSGDFYWWAEVENKTVIAVADCTGHGVPGAFMSLLGISYLREIVQKEYITHTSVVLQKLRKEIIRSLNQTGETGTQKDGMDMAIVSIDNETNMLQFSGANNPLYIIRSVDKSTSADTPIMTNNNLGLWEIKPDKMPIGIHKRMDKFSTVEFQLQKGDQLYMFSDGFADQFGGEKGKKFKSRAFKEIILGNAKRTMQEQHQILERTFDKWKGSFEQVDDVTILGIVV